VVLAVRAEGPTPGLLTALESDLRAVDGGDLLSPLETLDAHLIRTSLAPERIVRSLVAVCAVLAVVLSIAGVYAVMADLVVRRRRELALRIALGAGPVRLVRSVVREGMRLAVAGAVIGLIAAIAGAPLLERVVVRPRLPGPLAILTACLTVTLLVALACAIPAWRAVSVDPRTAMEE
jgi:ABC-type antimicrobial peptide transport system permease subunit